MDKKEISSHQQELLALLAGVSGHFEATSPQDERSIQSLQETLARVLSSEDITTVKNSFFSVEKADLFFTDTIVPHQLTRLQDLAGRVVKEAGRADLRVFVREVPVRSTQMKGSVPVWAGGAALEKTIGPFLNKDGRKIWFDFFRIEKLIALYIDGRPNPAILFNVSLLKRFIIDTLPPLIEPLTKYKLMPDSVWVNSEIFAPNAPAGFYTGLKIRHGEITLSAHPQIINGKLTISPNTIVTVKLDLDQPAVTDADPASPYGIDARNAALKLPKQLSFHFSGIGGSIDEIADNLHWNVYGYNANFTWNKQTTPRYDAVLNRVLIPFTCSENTFAVTKCQSPFNMFAGTADIKWSAWTLPAAQIDVTRPSQAAGIGGIAIQCKKGLTAQWKGLQGGEVNLTNPYVLCDIGRINITDLQAGNLYCNQEYKLWKDNANPFGSSIKLQYTNTFPFLYNTLANGNESLLALANANPLLDRPVTVFGQALDIHSKNSILLLAVNKAFKLIYLYDDNILFDNFDPKPLALALHNALFKVTPVNGCLLFGELSDDMVKVEKGNLFLTFGMYAYVPTLPDPYAANLGSLRFQFRGRQDPAVAGAVFGEQNIWQWLVCQVKWQPAASDNDNVEVSFHFAPLQNQFQLMKTASASTNSNTGDTPASSISSHPLFGIRTHLAGVGTGNPHTDVPETAAFAMIALATDNRLPDYDVIWNENTQRLQQDIFVLLDVSTNADLLGVSFGLFGDRRMAMITTHTVVPAATAATPGFPLQVKGMDVVSQGINVRAFTLPQISWEPVINLSEKHLNFDPPPGANYYEDDGGPTRISNTSVQLVPLAPIPLTGFIINSYNTSDIPTWSLFTLPFGLRALAVLQKNVQAARSPVLGFNMPTFEKQLRGGIQIMMKAGQVDEPGESNRFTMGYTVQICNVLDVNGQKTVFTRDGTLSGFSTLGQSVTEIFNNEFLIDPQKQNKFRGVPLTRIDFTGYGASIFSHWLNPNAVVAKTSQAKFDVWLGRTAHEVIQVRSIMYPWGIRVVRTITLFRTGSGYVYRVDSGWRAESDGNFDFSYKVYKKSIPDPIIEDKDSKYEIHPGIIKKLINIKEIKETNEIEPFKDFWIKTDADTYIDVNGYEIKVSEITDPKEKQNVTNPVDPNVKLQPVYFNADVLIENAIQGYNGQIEEIINGKNYQFGKVPSKRILGFVQIAPSGEPIPADIFRKLINYQQGSIGGPADCVANIGNSGQQMRFNRFDVSNSFAGNGTDPVFVVAGRGNVILPKDGSWSMVKHQYGTGEVSPVPEDLSVPLIRIGKLIKQAGQLVLDKKPDEELLRIANPPELLRKAVNDTINYGFLHSTDTQKALFLTPSFKQGLDKLLSKTPPLFADAFRIVNSTAIFPNIGDAVNNFGDTISLFKNGSEFAQNVLTDGGKQVLELMQINKAKEEGYKLLKNVPEFDLPAIEKTLIEIGSAFKIYIEYKADNIQKPKPAGGTKNLKGTLNFDVDSFASNLADRWKSRMSNVALVVDLGIIKRLMTIKGNWDARKGAEAQYKGSDTDPDFPSPQIEFSPELQPVIEILQILQDLQGENYKDAFQKGLKLAMSNKAGSWEYKFEAAKEIPVVRFPMPDSLYNDPNAPLKLEAGLKLGAYFNAALKVTTDPKQLLPTAGGYMEFYGRLSVMCVSLSVATVYAVGQVNLRIAADTKTGPSLAMKFGFGAQIVVGLPVVANVSVLYMVGVEIYMDSVKLNVSAFLLFQGHAELLDGIVAVTITIEAKGTISRANDRTDLAAQVTFAIDISIFLVIDIKHSESWQEQRQIA